MVGRREVWLLSLRVRGAGGPALRRAAVGQEGGSGCLPHALASTMAQSPGPHAPPPAPAAALLLSNPPVVKQLQADAAA